ncbi:MAG: hypothetical protein M1503_10125 [Thaumarchaeota archaeon]|nr:hypothetical protein [Nitrososphaerota archaeon]MCL5318598.1 hypothetical protein [Nitrososphaerota archaeon]
MIKLKQITTTGNNETTITVQYDQQNQLFTAQIPQKSIDEKLMKVQETLGRQPTKQDLIDAVKALVNEIREGNPPPTPINPAQFLDIDLEA